MHAFSARFVDFVDFVDFGEAILQKFYSKMGKV
jgi:hypothetical protein